MSKIDKIFIVGNSRSGTTMMGRILNNHPEIFTFKELHFFGRLFSSRDQSKYFNKPESIRLFSNLICIQEHGIFHKVDANLYNDISESVLCKSNYTPIEIYNNFLDYNAIKNKSSIACEQTPGNLFYLNEISNNLSNVKFINMVRDPRDILLSQKNKWRRRYFGASSIPFFETLRAFFNYHPITISKLWNSSLLSVLNFSNQSLVHTVYFEDLLINPEKVIRDVCLFLEIKFSSDMLNVPNIGSSNTTDLREIKIDKSKIEQWKSGGLTNAEIYLCQKLCGNMMIRNKYKLKKFSYFPLMTLLIMFTFPIKVFMALIFNLHRFRSFKDVIIKRIFPK